MNKKKSILIFTGVLVTVVLLIALITAFGSGGGFKKSVSGMEFKMVMNKAKEKAQDGQLMVAYITYKTEKDSVVFTTYSTPKKSTVFPVGKPKNVGDMNEAFLMLGTKDSAIFRLPSDSIFKGNDKRPAFAGKGTYIVVGIRVDTVVSSDDYTKMQMQLAEKQKTTDDDLIKKYIADNNLKAERTADGLYYVIDKNGTGNNAKAGTEVSVLYKGMLIDGTEFDSSEKNGGKPFKVKIGTHSVIQGWDEGLTYFNKGASGLLLIPSGMAYGPKEYPGRIPANSVLVFQIQVLDIK